MADLNKLIQEITGEDEKRRRAEQLKRHEIYKDGGRRFLIEQIKREFGQESIKEMRLAPINLLKKIINKRSSIYKRPPIRVADGNQDLVDYYVEELSFNEVMAKCNRYLNLFSNTVLYTVPIQEEEGTRLDCMVVPPYQYSIVANPLNLTEIESFVFSQFIEEGEVAEQNALRSATGRQDYDKQRGYKFGADLIASQEIQTDPDRLFIYWDDFQHFTFTDKGVLIQDPEKEAEQFLNPIERYPITNVARDRDNEAWATQGEDLVDLTLAVQLGMSDLLTIAKHQGFSILTIIAEDEPKRLNIGVNKGVFLKARDGGPRPEIGYTQATSPIQEYKELVLDLIGLTLSTNDMSPSSISATGGQKANSGLQQLLEMSDTIEARKQDEPLLRDAEQDHWQVIAKYHNWLADQGLLNKDAKALGRFTDDFDISISYQDDRPIESEEDRINRAARMLDLGLATKGDALQIVRPDLTDEQAEEKLQEIQEEKDANRARMESMMGGSNGPVQDESRDQQELEDEAGEPEETDRPEDSRRNR